MNPCSDEEYFYKFDNMVTRSTQYLRKIFKQRWEFESGERWKDDINYIRNFCSGPGENMLKRVTPLQKKILFDSCSLENWDLSLMALVLLNCFNGKNYKLQNQAVRQLKDLRNDLAHHKNKRLTQKEYCEKLKTLKERLKILRIPKEEVEKLIQESSVISSFEDTEHVKTILRDTEELINLQNFEAALQKCSEAILLPNLSTVNLGKIYEKRAVCHMSIKIGQNIDEKHIDQAMLDLDQAMLDLDQALDLNECSWNAHYLKAQCYKAKNNFHCAIHCYIRALEISPQQKQIKQDLDSCCILESMQKENANLDLDKLPKTESDIVGDTKYKCGRKITFAEINGLERIPVFLGQNYFYGLGVSQDYAKAIEYFTEAERQGSTLGSLMIGNCYYLGHGVPQDVAKSVEIFKRCAKTDAKKKRKFEAYTSLGYNSAVATAEYSIGKCYNYGTGVEENFTQAAIWYTRGMEHGNGDAASCLGLLYYMGQGVEMDAKMAAMCWKQSVNFGCTEAAEFLVEYYCDQLEPEMALAMFKICREMGSSKFLKMSEKDFNRRRLAVCQAERCRLEDALKKVEHAFTLDFKGMTFRERLAQTEDLHCLGDKVVQRIKCVVEQKEYLRSPVRIGLIKQHRERLADKKCLKQDDLSFDDSVIPGKLQQKRAKQMNCLTNITLQKMNPNNEKIYQNRSLDLTIIEKPNLYFNSIQLIAEDENGDTTRVYVDQVRKGTFFMNRFEAGCRIAVINPYMGECAIRGVNGIRINEHKCIVFLEKIENLCRLCGEENGLSTFSKQKRLYCSRFCQRLDKQLFEQPLRCSVVEQN